MTVGKIIEVLRAEEIIVPNEWLSKLKDVKEQDIQTDSASAIQKVVGCWEEWMLNPTPEEKGKIAGRALLSISTIGCSSFNVIPNSRSNIKSFVNMSKNTPDIVTIINESSAVILIDEQGRKNLL